mgnify:FL=1
MAEVEIAGKKYVTKTQVTRTPIRDFTPAYRTTATPRRQDRKDLAALEFSHFLNGFGSRYALAKDERTFNRFWDSQNVMTHWLSQLSPSFLAEDTTEPVGGFVGSNDTLIGPIDTVHFKGDYIGLFHAPYDNSGGSVFVAKYSGSGTAWTGFTRVKVSTTATITLGDSPTYSGATIVVTINSDTVTTLTEGSSFLDPGTGSSNTDVLGARIASAIGGITGVSAAYDNGTNVVTITLASTEWGLTVVDNSGRGTAANPAGVGVHTGMSINTQGGYLTVLTVEEGTHKMYRATAYNGTWADASTQPTTGMMVAQSVGDRDAGGFIQALDANLYAGLWDEDNGQIEIWKSTNQGDDWTAVSTAVVTSGSGPRGHALFPDRNGDMGIAFGSAEAVYMLDVSAGTISIIESLGFHDNHCHGLTTYLGALYVSTGDGGVLKISYIDGQYVSEEVGPNKFDGLPVARQGYFHMFSTSRGFLIGSYGGHSGTTKASILLYNGAGWHALYTSATANRIIPFVGFSSADDGTERMHFWLILSTTTQSSHFQATPLNNPGDGGTYKYEATGLLLLPEQSLDLPEVPAVWLTVDADAVGLASQSSSQEYVTVDYGIQGGDWQDSELGHLESGVTSLSFGSGLGVSSPTMLLSLEFKRRSGTDTEYVFVRNFTASLRKVYSTRYAYRMIIDAEATALAHRSTFGNADGVITQLEAIQDSITQVTLKYGKISVNAGAIKDWEYREVLGDNAPPLSANLRDTDVAIHLIQLI